MNIARYRLGNHCKRSSTYNHTRRRYPSSCNRIDRRELITKHKQIWKIQISIKKTGNGFDFHNANAWDFPLVATIREGKNKPGIYLWRILDESKSGFHDLEGAKDMVKMHLTQIAAERLGSDIEFIEE